MKTALYVATVARTYRKAIDDCLESEEKYRANMDWYHREISRCTYRQFTTGFYYGKPNEESQIYDSNTYQSDAVYLGTVYETDHKGRARIEQRNKFSVGEEIEVMPAKGPSFSMTVTEIYNEAGESVESAPHPQEKLRVKFSQPVQPFDMMRKFLSDTK